MKEINVECIQVVESPVELDVTSFDGKGRSYMGIREMELEFIVYANDRLIIPDKLDILQRGEKVIINSSKKCMLIQDYILGDYFFMDHADDREQVKVRLALREQPVIAKDKDGILKELI